MMEQEHGSGGHRIRSVEEIARAAATVAAELRRSAAATAAAGGGSIQRGLSPDIQSTFIDVRGALYARGIFDPVLARFDSATSAPASNGQIADQLETIARSLTS
jgi:hypothetical protein